MPRQRTPRDLPPKPPPPIPRSDGPTPIENWYLTCLKRMSRYLGRAPSCGELSVWIGRSVTPTYRMLSILESRGLVKRDDRRRFLPVGK